MVSTYESFIASLTLAARIRSPAITQLGGRVEKELLEAKGFAKMQTSFSFYSVDTPKKEVKEVVCLHPCV